MPQLPQLFTVHYSLFTVSFSRRDAERLGHETLPRREAPSRSLRAPPRLRVSPQARRRTPQLPYLFTVHCSNGSFGFLALFFNSDAGKGLRLPSPLTFGHFSDFHLTRMPFLKWGFAPYPRVGIVGPLGGVECAEETLQRFGGKVAKQRRRRAPAPAWNPHLKKAPPITSTR